MAVRGRGQPRPQARRADLSRGARSLAGPRPAERFLAHVGRRAARAVRSGERLRGAGGPRRGTGGDDPRPGLAGAASRHADRPRLRDGRDPGPQGGGDRARRRGVAPAGRRERGTGAALSGRGAAPGAGEPLLMQPRISVILPVFNGRRFLPGAVRSVLAQTLPPCELIVVDDGSSDGSLEELDNLPPAPFPVRVLRQANAGQSAARNAAAREATGEYLAFLDQDDAWYPRHLEELVAPLAADPAAGWAYCDFDEMDAGGNLVTRAFIRAQGVVHPKRTIYECVEGDLMVLPSASVMRRGAFEAAGGFDEALSGYEDDDLFVRFFRLGWEHVFVDRPLLRFRIHASGSWASLR
ncbi:MAG: hypothetical protein DMF53_10750 [Acidobacteria bacterium]|nr:MAG: hypothetical protein DMF53_10750 [Acidobacteriota bacterium]